MKLTRASVYALEAMDYLARHKGEAPVPSHLIAAERKVPERFLLKVLKPLVTARLLASVKGPHGGYRLARLPNKITLLEVLEAVDGAIRGVAPLEQDPGRKSTEFDSRLQEVCDKAADLVRKGLKKVSISDLAS